MSLDLELSDLYCAVYFGMESLNVSQTQMSNMGLIIAICSNFSSSLIPLPYLHPHQWNV